MFLGIQDDGVVVMKRGDRDRALRQAKELGVRHFRFVIYSNIIAKHGFTLYDEAINAIRAAGMYPQVAITGSPRWDPDAGTVKYVDPDPVAFGHLVGLTVSRYKGTIARYAMWNEPNHPAFMNLSSGHTADHYAELYREGWRAAKNAYGRSQILFGELASSKLLLRWLDRAAKGQKAHGFGWHPYQYQIAPEQKDPEGRIGIGHIDEVQALLTRLRNEGRLRTPGGKPLPIYMTEFGYFREGWHSKSIPESQRAEWTDRAWRWAEKHGTRQLVYYHLTEPPAGTIWNTGLVSQEGALLAPYHALKAVAA